MAKQRPETTTDASTAAAAKAPTARMPDRDRDQPGRALRQHAGRAVAERIEAFEDLDPAKHDEVVRKASETTAEAASVSCGEDDIERDLGDGVGGPGVPGEDEGA
jgi:hypothetical protein